MSSGAADAAPRGPYAAAMLDWLGCAAAGRREPAARAAADLGDPLLAGATAGHVLDFDDTWAPGLAHLSAPTAPAALHAVAARGGTAGEALAAYAHGFETMAVLAAHAHPCLYERGLHPTAVCGGVGAAAAWVAGTKPDAAKGVRASALALALARAAGLQASFGGDGKSLGVAAAATAGRDAARLALAGARAELGAILTGACRAWEIEPLDSGALLAGSAGGGAIAENWIKAYPCCLQTHSAIEAALTVDAERAQAGRLRVRVHPISLRAAAVERPLSGLEAKFSISYLVAWALLRGRLVVESFESLDDEVLEAGSRIVVEADAGLGQSEAVLDRDGYELARVREALGSPSRPMSSDELEHKVSALGGPALPGALDDPQAAAAGVLAAAGLPL